VAFLLSLRAAGSSVSAGTNGSPGTSATGNDALLGSLPAADLGADLGGGWHRWSRGSDAHPELDDRLVEALVSAPADLGLPVEQNLLSALDPNASLLMDVRPTAGVVAPAHAPVAAVATLLSVSPDSGETASLPLSGDEGNIRDLLINPAGGNPAHSLGLFRAGRDSSGESGADVSDVAGPFGDSLARQVIFAVAGLTGLTTSMARWRKMRAAKRPWDGLPGQKFRLSPDDHLV
jgi:hypothetical protein